MVSLSFYLFIIEKWYKYLNDSFFRIALVHLVPRVLATRSARLESTESCSAFFFRVLPFFFCWIQPQHLTKSSVNSAQISLFSNFFIKNGSHDIIHTFKNYFATVFSVSVFNFSNNKLNLNGLIIETQLASTKGLFGLCLFC